MKIKHLLLSAIAVATALVSCQKDPSKEKASLTLSDSEISFETSAEGTKTVTLTSTRMWEAQIPTAAAEWVSVSPDKGEASANPQTIEITVKPNTGNDRTAEISFRIVGGTKTLKVSQKGDQGEAVKGDGSLEKPFNVAEAIVEANKNSFTPPTDNDKINALPDYYVKGIISNIKNVDTGQYGNAEFNISDDGKTTSPQFLIYRCYYLNGEHFKSEGQIKVGDEVVVLGKIFNAFGNTPELNNGGVIISINGSGQPGPYMSVTPLSKTVNYNAGSFTVNVSANQSWTVTDGTFASASVKSGNNNGEVTISYTENSTAGERTDNIVFKAADNTELVLVITQAEQGGVAATEITWEKADWQVDGSVATLEKDGYTITVSKEGGSTNPAVRDNGDIRLYAKGTLKVSGPTALTSVVVTLASDAGYKYTTVTADSGAVGAQAVGDKEFSWTGSAQTVTFTVGDYATLGSDGATKGGQIRFNKISVK